MSYKIEWEDVIETASSPKQATLWATISIAKGESIRFTVTDLKTNKQYIVDGDQVTEVENHNL